MSPRHKDTKKKIDTYLASGSLREGRTNASQSMAAGKHNPKLKSNYTIKSCTTGWNSHLTFPAFPPGSAGFTLSICTAIRRGDSPLLASTSRQLAQNLLP